MFKYVRWFNELSLSDLPFVGGKNASLGEMVTALEGRGISVPFGFALTAAAYRLFIEENGLDKPLNEWLARLAQGQIGLAEAGQGIRALFFEAPLPEEVAREAQEAYRELSRMYGEEATDVAVRSSATSEDLPEASFAGQQETFLNVRGVKELLDACRRCFASLFTDRAISYREEKGFDHLRVALSVGVQKMVRSDAGGSGVMFTIDTESGFPGVIVINAAWGLGEAVVRGLITPDEFIVAKGLLDKEGVRPVISRTLGEKTHKLVYASAGHTGRGGVRSVPTTEDERRSFVLSDDEVMRLARWGVLIERHYGRPMDIEWAKDGVSGDLFVLQARPETVHSLQRPGIIRRHRLKGKGKPLVTGLSIGQGVASGRVSLVRGVADAARVPHGAILVAASTDPDWVPVMRRAAGIVTDHGGRTCHAAIVSRELGIPAVVGTSQATRVLREGQEVTLSCAEGDRGVVYEGLLDFEEELVDLGENPATRTRVMINMADPQTAFRWWWLPCDGIGLARVEFIIANLIRVHPMALIRFDEVTDQNARRQISDLTQGYGDKREYFVQRLAEGIAKLAVSQYPRPVIVRTSDFKTNEYARLIGGRQFEPEEENPMLGLRGASRYYHEIYRDAFALECQAVRRVREGMGLDNVSVMIPYCRTLAEADQVLEVMAAQGLRRGANGLQVYVMCEVPSNVILAEGFAQRFDGFSIGSNDLTQLVLGVDRDSPALAGLFDERDEAVKRVIQEVIRVAHRHGCTVGICGQAPSDYPEFVDFLVEAGIDSISVNPDSFVRVKQRVAAVEARSPGSALLLHWTAGEDPPADELCQNTGRKACRDVPGAEMEPAPQHDQNGDDGMHGQKP